MKLVTGIEAIQSGKPFKLVPDTEWTLPDSIIGQVTAKELLEKIWIIKEEPREFWIDTSNDVFWQAFTGDYKGADTSGANWIRVREIEK